MEGLNRVMLLGDLGADPELRVTRGGQSVLKLRMATNERYQDRNQEWKDRTEWHNIVVWGKRAESLSKILQKGSRLFIEGGLRTSSYEDREGNKRYKTEVQANHVILAGGDRRQQPSAQREAGDANQGSGGGGYDDFDGGDDLGF